MTTVATRYLLRLSVGLAASVSVACGGGEKAPREEAAAEGAIEAREGVVKEVGTPAAAPGYEVIDVTNAGTVTGVVRFVGAAPPPRIVKVTEDAEACGSTRRVQTVQVGANRALADVIASLTDIRRGAAPVVSSAPPALDQAGCSFAPHVLLVPAGATVNVLNSDPITHNIHTLAFENRPINKAQPSFMKKLEVSFRVPEKVKVSCDIHEWMGAWIVVMDHPYYAVTGEDGSFTIRNVPAGTYTLEVWHETLGMKTQQVTVTAGGTTEVAFELGPQT